MKISNLTMPRFGWALLLLASSFAYADPVSTLYLTYTNACAPTPACIAVLHSGSVTSIPTVSTVYEIPIAVSGDIRTMGALTGVSGHQYSLGGTSTGAAYAFAFPSDSTFWDSTTDGTSNYLVDFNLGGVYRTDRNFQNPTRLFTVAPGHLGITYDGTNNSLWISGWYANTTVWNYSMSGVLLSSFDPGFGFVGALALDPADQTLWLVDAVGSGQLKQYSKAGAPLSTGSNVGYTLGGEFNYSPVATPEPGSLVLLGTGAVLFAFRRRIRR